MGWRVVSIENPARLSLDRGSLVVKLDQEARIPIEDIDVLLIDNYAVTISTRLLGELATKGVSVIICDSHHTPSSVTLPLSQHSRQAKISNIQAQMAQPLRKNLWQNIVKQKIINQSAVLKKFNHPEAADKLLELAAKVRSEDSTNRESVAARLYFSDLLDDTTRRQPTWHNAALNYCYAIIRGVVARSIAINGLIPSIGLFHHSELNGFNLADDLIEPYRAFADNYVLSIMTINRIDDREDQLLSAADRHLAVDIVNNYVIIDDRRVKARYAIEISVESLVRAMKLGDATQLKLPRLIV